MTDPIKFDKVKKEIFGENPIGVVDFDRSFDFNMKTTSGYKSGYGIDNLKKMLNIEFEFNNQDEVIVYISFKEQTTDEYYGFSSVNDFDYYIESDNDGVNDLEESIWRFFAKFKFKK